MNNGCTIWFTGLSGSGKTTCSTRLVNILKEKGYMSELLDGDMIRTNLCDGLSFSKEDRDKSCRRISFVSKLLSRNGVIVCVAAISPYNNTRKEIKKELKDFILVYCDAPISILKDRDVKGLYKKAITGEIKNFTGISDPYEIPDDADVIIYSDGKESVEESVEKILLKLKQLSYIKG